VVTRPLRTLTELDTGSQLIERIWDDGEPKAPTSFLRALSHSGGFVAGAYGDGELVGISFGFLGLEGDELYLHSHITGVAPTFRGRSVGFALKQFQRAWALARGIQTITWTADPLVRTNMHFNVVKLGTTIVAYHQDFYGPLRDTLNAGQESDRVVMRWELASARAERAAEGNPVPPARADGNVILRAGPESEPATAPADGEVLRAWIPPDIVRLRAERPACAHAWREALRHTAGRALAEGYRADWITADGWLVLTR
jgi:predicted GNAT superfamily acetyltransferase